MTGQIGQIEKSIDSTVDHLTEEEFKDYCDHAYSCIAYLKLIEMRIKLGAKASLNA